MVGNPNSYSQRIQRVTDYVAEHLDDAVRYSLLLRRSLAPVLSMRTRLCFSSRSSNVIRIQADRLVAETTHQVLVITEKTDLVVVRFG